MFRTLAILIILTLSSAPPLWGDPGYFGQEIGCKVQMASGLEKIGLTDFDSSRVVQTVPQPIVLTAAQHECESFQLILTPQPDCVPRVNMWVTPLRGPGGRTIPSSNVTINAVGYIRITPNNGPEIIMPDPLLICAIPDLAPGENQPIWIMVRVPDDAPAGEYSGDVMIGAEGAYSLRIPLILRVRNFAIPKKITLRSSFWTFRSSLEDFYRRDVTMDEYLKWIDFALDHRLCPVDQQGSAGPLLVLDPPPGAPPDWQPDWTNWDRYLDRMIANGAGTIPLSRANNEGLLGSTSSVINHMRLMSDHYKAKGIFDLHQCQLRDETPDEFTLNLYQAVHAALPDVKLLLTAPSSSFRSVLQIPCPLTWYFNSGWRDEVKAAGGEYWWYMCGDPGDHYANFLVHYGSVWTRTFFWQNWRNSVDGLLFFGLNIIGYAPAGNIGPNQRVQPSGTTNWQPDQSCPGDGMSIYPGPTPSQPISSIRLEAMRDGEEDYEYLIMLDSVIAYAQAHGISGPALNNAIAARTAARSLVPSGITGFSTDPAQYLAVRQQIASAIDGLTTDAQAPSVPSGVSGVAQSSTSVRVNWIASTDNYGVTGYRLYRNGSQVNTPSSTTYLDTGLSAGATYSYTVSAYDAAGNNSAQSSPPAVVTAQTPTGPGVPTGVWPTPQSETSVRVIWTAPTDGTAATGYKIYRNGSQVGTTATTSYMDTGLAAYTTYSYTVSAYDAGGSNSAQSSPLVLATTPDNTLPSVPSAVSAVAQSETTVLVTWTASTDNVAVGGYKVYRGGTQVGTTAATSYTDSGLSPSATYSYTVSAYDLALNDSAQSSPPATATTPDNTAPSVPMAVSAVAQSLSTIRIFWTASTDNVGVTGYKVFRNGTQVGTSATTTYLDSGLSPVTAYSYTVAAYDAAGNTSAQSAPPAVEMTQADTDAPSVPTSVLARPLRPTAIELGWTASTDNVGVAGYAVYRNGAQVGTSAITVYTDTGLAPNTTYSYSIAAYDAAGNRSAGSSPPVSANTGDNIFDLGVLSPANAFSEATDLTNQTGTTAMSLFVSGSSKNASGIVHPVQWSGTWNNPNHWYMSISGPNDLEPALAVNSHGTAISANGTRVTADQGAVYRSNGGTWTKDALGGTSPTCGDINPAGDRAVGTIDVEGSIHGAIWTWNGSGWTAPVDLGNYGVAGTGVYGTSGADRICGYRYKSGNDCYQGMIWKWSGSSWALETTLGDLVANGRTFGRDISSDGTKVAGESAGHAYLWEWNGSTWVGTNVGTLSGGSASAAYGISSNGQYIVGWAYNGSGAKRAVKWAKSGGSWTIQDLNSLIPPTSVWILQQANAVNDTGWVAGSGTRDGITRAFLLTEHDTQAPSIPTNVHATGQTPRAIGIAWNASTDNAAVAGYKVYRNGGQVGTSGTTNYTDTGLSPNTTYSYTVSAYDAAGNNSAQSSPPATATTTQAMDIAEAKQLGNSATVGFIGKTVVAVMADCFYIEETDRSSGIKVVPVQMPAGLAVGQMVDVGGTIVTGDSGERYVGDAVVTVN